MIELIDFPKYLVERVNLSFIKENKQISYKSHRVHWIYDVPSGEVRGGLSYKETEEFIVALSGSFDVFLDNGIERKTFCLNHSYYSVYIPKGSWREMNNFSTNSVALILASTFYDPNDAIREYSEFLNYVK